MGQTIAQTYAATIFPTPLSTKLQGAMHLTRMLPSSALALVATLLLIMVMARLIATEYELPGVESPPTIAPVVLPDLISTIEPNIEKPERPKQPPKVSTPQQQNTKLSPVDMGVVIQSPVANGTKLKVLSISSDPLPIHRPPPRYPSVAMRRGVEGYAIVEFTITKSGSVRDPHIVGAFDSAGKPTKLFDRAALNAALKFKYKPLIQNGKAAEQRGVRNKISFKLAD